MKRLLGILSSLLLVAALAVAAVAAGAQDMGAKVASACSACHSLKRTCAKLGNDQAYWQSAVQRMYDNGAQMAGSEVGPMAAYLAGLAKAKAPFCK